MKRIFSIIILIFIFYSCSNKDTRSTFKKGTDAFYFKKYNSAIEYMDITLKSKPNFAEAYFVRANSYEKIGNFKKAVEDYSFAIKYNPKFKGAYRRRGFVYLSMGDTINGHKDLLKAIFINSYNGK